MPLAWHYTTELFSGLGVFDLTQADVAYLQVVQSRREGTAVRQPEAFLLKYMRGNRHRLDLGSHIIRQRPNKINRIKPIAWHYIFEPVAYRQQLYQYLTPSAYAPTVEDQSRKRWRE